MLGLRKMSAEKYQIRTLGEYQRMMDSFETAQDSMTLPDVRILLRVDAHRFGPTWSSEPDSEYPFGPRFISALHDTAVTLMACGLKTSFAYMHGDEVSLLLAEAESNNSRRRSRLLSIASSAAAAAFQGSFGKPALFFTKLCELPNPTRVLDYFFWQRKVAMRNFLSRTLGILLEKQGLSDSEISTRLHPLDEAGRRSLLLELGRTPDTVSEYEKYGLAYWWDLDSADGETLCFSKTLPPDDTSYLRFLQQCLAGPGVCAAENFPSQQMREIGNQAIAPKTATESSSRTPSPTPPSATPTAKAAFRIGPKGKR